MAAIIARTPTSFTLQIEVTYNDSMLDFEEALQERLNEAGVVATAEGLKQFEWQGPTSQLAAHQTSLEELFQADPPHTTAEACRRIEEATGIKRGLTQVRRFLKKVSV